MLLYISDNIQICIVVFGKEQHLHRSTQTPHTKELRTELEDCSTQTNLQNCECTRHTVLRIPMFQFYSKYLCFSFLVSFEKLQMRNNFHLISRQRVGWKYECVRSSVTSMCACCVCVCVSQQQPRQRRLWFFNLFYTHHTHINTHTHTHTRVFEKFFISHHSFDSLIFLYAVTGRKCCAKILRTLVRIKIGGNCIIMIS